MGIALPLRGDCCVSQTAINPVADTQQFVRTELGIMGILDSLPHRPLYTLGEYEPA